MKKRKVGLIIFGIFIVAVSLGLFLIWQKKYNFEASSPQNGQQNQKNLGQQDADLKSPLSGLACRNGQRRPIAVMLSGDAVARPLSGISQADLVFEMPVTEGSITRLMAVFVCAEPKEIGSVRSARHDFIPLALGVDAIYAHWGGSHFALDKLKTGIIDNLDALPNLYNTFYRQSGIPSPHNGFTSITRLLNAAQKLNYRLTTQFTGYLHLSSQNTFAHSQEKKILTIDYPSPFKVSYQYNPESNSYLRFRNNLKEIDKNTAEQVEAKNVVIMRAESRPLEGEYNDVQVEGEGKAEFYLNGQIEQGIWKKNKNNSKSKLFFYNKKGEEVRFVPGQIWIEIIEPDRSVIYQ